MVQTAARRGCPNGLGVPGRSPGSSVQSQEGGGEGGRSEIPQRRFPSFVPALRPLVSTRDAQRFSAHGAKKHPSAAMRGEGCF